MLQPYLPIEQKMFEQKTALIFFTFFIDLFFEVTKITTFKRGRSM